MNNKRKVYYVKPNEKDWDVKAEGGMKASNKFANKEDAIVRAKELAKKNDLSQVKIMKQDGTFQTEYTYGEDPNPPKG